MDAMTIDDLTDWANQGARIARAQVSR